jgi:hypothetical protein
LLLSCALSGCSAPLHRFMHSDLMCSRIARFANAAQDHSTHSVELITEWGTVRLASQKTLSETGCRHEEYRPAAELCDYLMEHTSAEFPDLNVARALRCLPGGAALTIARPGPTDSLLRQKAGSFAWARARYTDRGVRVQIAWTLAQKDTAPRLTISARRLE